MSTYNINKNKIPTEYCCITLGVKGIDENAINSKHNKSDIKITNNILK